MWMLLKCTYSSMNQDLCTILIFEKKNKCSQWTHFAYFWEKVRIINLSSTCNRDVIMHVCFIVLIRVLSREFGRIVRHIHVHVCNIMCFLSMISYVVLCVICGFFLKKPRTFNKFNMWFLVGCILLKFLILFNRL